MIGEIISFEFALLVLIVVAIGILFNVLNLLEQQQHAYVPLKERRYHV